MGPSRSDHEPPGSGGAAGPRPVPELPGPVAGGPVTGAPVTGAPVTGGPVPGGPVTDDDRQRFGVLLDRALERGLLDPVEYQHRLGAIAAATTLEELRDLVTELPVLRTGAGVPVSGVGGGPGGGPGGGARYGASGEAHQAWLASLGRPRYGATSGPRRSPWPVLVVVLVVLVLLVVILAVVGAHLARTHQQGLAARPSSPVAVVGRPVAVAWFASTGRAERAPVPVSPSRL